MKYIFSFILIDCFIAIPQINLHYTKQNHCIRVYPIAEAVNHQVELMSFCLSDLPIFENEEDISPRWTFEQLSQLNITSELLYLWSASMDLAEDYEDYLINLPSPTFKDKLFHNCSGFHFGDRCEYELYDDLPLPVHFSLEEYFQEYYFRFRPDHSAMTCYTHMKCNYSSFSSGCLSWYEICDGKIDCFNDGIDEQDCWQLEINECQPDEYRCKNGQCIPKVFYSDQTGMEDCYDGSDEDEKKDLITYFCVPGSGPSFACEEVRGLFTIPNSKLGQDGIATISDPLSFDDRLEIIYFPHQPVLFGQVYFAYRKLDLLQSSMDLMQTPLYICYTGLQYDAFFRDSNQFSLDNLTCVDSRLFLSSDTHFLTIEEHFRSKINQLHALLRKYHMPYNYTSIICNRSTMYQCSHSPKCISLHRVFDLVDDCPESDDENEALLLKFEYLKKTHFQCQTTGKYIPQGLVNNSHCDCTNRSDVVCDDEDFEIVYLQKTIVFQHICDGFVDFSPLFIDGKNQSDETDCELWQCDNIYTHCDQIWNCRNGLDESDCYPSGCPSKQHRCVSTQTKQLICLPIEKINDQRIDCLGGYDELHLCAKMNQFFPDRPVRLYPEFSCQKDGFSSCLYHRQLCDGKTDCDSNDDEIFCEKDFSLRFQLPSRKWGIIPFILEKNIEPMDTSHVSSVFDRREHPCHRGLHIRVRINHRREDVCFCPLNYYGSKCEYENERVSLTVQFRAPASSWERMFTIVICLIEQLHEKKVIHSYEQIQYLSIRDCQKKFNLYLIYSTAPKNRTKQYAIEMHFYERESFHYRGSVLHHIKFSFLPVYRLALRVDIPKSTDKNHAVPFNQTECACAFGSLCHGKTIDHRSICLCPMKRFGPRCLLHRRTNDSICEHNGTYISMDYKQDFVCLCPRGFRGNRCQLVDHRMILILDANLLHFQSIFIHFISINRSNVIRTTTFQSIVFQQTSIPIFWSEPYHLIFIELTNRSYYLVQSSNETHSIHSSDRCPNISELFPRSYFQRHFIHRIKSYHIPCRNRSLNLSCFHDHLHLCICYQFENTEYLSNCFRFDHQLKYDCFGLNECENQGQCLQDQQTCPTKSMCLCQACFYGRLCQFSSNGFSLSIDGILGYQISPTREFSLQPKTIHLSLGVTIVFVLLGFFNSACSIITFQNKATRKVGCGLYLFVSSIVSLLLIILFQFKFIILLLTQMTIISNEIFLKIQCHLIDFLLGVCLIFNHWLYACIATERAVTIIQGVRFVKSKSLRLAKLVISLALILILGSCIHDPIFRRLAIEESEIAQLKRIWCIVRYSPTVRTYHYIIHSLHFLAPFLLSFISTICFILIKTRQDKTLQVKRSYQIRLQEEFQKYQHLLIAPIVLTLLQIPSLIFTFFSKCMKSADDFWLFLIGYFLSFLPSMLTFIIFVLPSKFYQKEFHKTIQHCRANLRRRLHC